MKHFLDPYIPGTCVPLAPRHCQATKRPEKCIPENESVGKGAVSFMSYLGQPRCAASFISLSLIDDLDSQPTESLGHTWVPKFVCPRLGQWRDRFAYVVKHELHNPVLFRASHLPYLHALSTICMYSYQQRG
jgi:hypothetical protein